MVGLDTLINTQSNVTLNIQSHYSRCIQTVRQKKLMCQALNLLQQFACKVMRPGAYIKTTDSRTPAESPEGLYQASMSHVVMDSNAHFAASGRRPFFVQAKCCLFRGVSPERLNITCVAVISTSCCQSQNPVRPIRLMIWQ